MIVCDNLLLKGLIHKAEGAPCQDAVAAFRHKRNVALALADGAGSYQYAEVGAKRISRAASRYMARNLDYFLRSSNETVVASILWLIRFELHKLHAEFPETDEYAFASTLLIVGSDGRRYVSFHLGDGAIMQQKGNGIVQMLSAMIPGQDRGTYLTTSPDEDIMANAMVHRGKANAFLLTSDGAERRLYNETEISDSCSVILDNFRCGYGRQYGRYLSDQIKHDLKPTDDFSLGILIADAPSAAVLKQQAEQQNTPYLTKYLLKAAQYLNRGTPHLCSAIPRFCRPAVRSALYDLYVR